MYPTIVPKESSSRIEQREKFSAKLSPEELEIFAQRLEQESKKTDEKFVLQIGGCGSDAIIAALTKFSYWRCIDWAEKREDSLNLSLVEFRGYPIHRDAGSGVVLVEPRDDEKASRITVHREIAGTILHSILRLTIPSMEPIHTKSHLPGLNNTLTSTALISIVDGSILQSKHIRALQSILTPATKMLLHPSLSYAVDKSLLFLERQQKSSSDPILLIPTHNKTFYTTALLTKKLKTLIRGWLIVDADVDPAGNLDEDILAALLPLILPNPQSHRLEREKMDWMVLLRVQNTATKSLGEIIHSQILPHICPAGFLMEPQSFQDRLQGDDRCHLFEVCSVRLAEWKSIASRVCRVTDNTHCDAKSLSRFFPPAHPPLFENLLPILKHALLIHQNDGSEIQISADALQRELALIDPEPYDLDRFHYLTALRNPVARTVSEFKHVYGDTVTWDYCLSTTVRRASTPTPFPTPSSTPKTKLAFEVPNFVNLGSLDVILSKENFLEFALDVKHGWGMRNRQTRMISGCSNVSCSEIYPSQAAMLRTAQRRLMTFDWVGVVDQASDGLLLLNHMFQWSIGDHRMAFEDRDRKTLQFDPMDPEIVAAILELNVLDQHLYLFAREILNFRLLELKRSLLIRDFPSIYVCNKNTEVCLLQKRDAIHW